jgi:hypothetical protein
VAKFEFKTKLPLGEMFLVRSSEIEGRIDVGFYQHYQPNINSIKLSKLASMQGGKRLPKGRDYTDDETDFLYFRVSDMEEYGNTNFENCKFITAETYKELARYELFEDDLVISIAGTIGKIQRIKSIPQDKKIILTENCAKISIKDVNKLNPEYLCLILKTEFVQQQIMASSIQTTIPKLGLDKVLALKIPVIPPLDVQDEIIHRYENALLARNNKLKQAQTLLNSINSYLLGELGITLPETDNSLNSRMFTVKMSDVGGGAFDPFTQFNKHYRIEGGKYPNERLDNIAFLQKGQSITSDDIVSGDYPVIAGGQTSPYSHNVCNHKGNVITVSASGAYSGYVWYHDYPIFASDCTVIFSKDENELITEFLAEVLKVKQQEIYLLQKGAGQPHVYPNDLAKLNIPLPDKPTQQKIIAHIQAIKARAATLQAEAEQLLNQTKAEIEQMILGNTL